MTVLKAVGIVASLIIVWWLIGVAMGMSIAEGFLLGLCALSLAGYYRLSLRLDAIDRARK